MKLRSTAHPERGAGRGAGEGDGPARSRTGNCPGSCGAPDTLYLGTLKGVGRIYQRAFIDMYSKVGFAKLYDRNAPLTVANLPNNRVIPFVEEHGIPLNTC